MGNEVWGKKYKDYTIMADYRVHEEVIQVLKRKGLNSCKLLDIACGEGALSQRIKDNFPGWTIDVNDLEPNIKFKDYQKKFSLNLNETFSFQDTYDVVIAVEIVEHLENPWAFFRGIKSILKKNGLAIVTTPNVNSTKDRMFYLIEGHPIYFGKRGIENSGGHINMLPRWEIEHICSQTGLTLEAIDAIDERSSGWRTKLMKILLLPMYPLLKERNNTSIYIFSITTP